MKKSDILIAARPDQALDIYEALCKQDELKFHMVCFKVARSWVKRILPLKKLRAVGKNCSIVKWGTFKHLAIYKFRFPFAKNWTDTDILDGKVRKLLKRQDFRIIHYWAENCGDSVKEYVRRNPSCFAIADIHMPHPKVVFDEMKPVYQKYGLNPEDMELYELTFSQGKLVEGIQNVMVPSSYVADTYRQLYPDKDYFVVPYGIYKAQAYRKNHRKEIKNFMYAGNVSLEKGCDVLLDYFTKHPEYNIHLFGIILDSQAEVFKKYKGIPNITFYGQVAKSDLQDYFVQFDAGIHLSRFDAYSLAVGEIIGSGKPAIVSDKTGIADDLLKYGFGLVCKISEESLNQAIREMTDPKTYNKFVDNIDKFIGKGTKSYGEMTIDFYKEHLK